MYTSHPTELHMRKILIATIFLAFFSCSSNERETIVLTEESFSVEQNTTGLFASDNIIAEINENLTFLRMTAIRGTTSFTLEIGSHDANAPVLTEGIYSFNEHGEFTANIIRNVDGEIAHTEAGFFRQIEITSIDLDSGIIYGGFSGILSGNIQLSDGKFIGVFFSVEE